MLRALRPLLLTVLISLALSFCVNCTAQASETPIWDNLLQALYLETGGTFEWAPDVKDGYPGMHMEPRYNVGGGLSWGVTKRLEMDMGYRWQAMTPIPGRVYDTLDKSQTLYWEFRYRPFQKD